MDRSECNTRRRWGDAGLRLWLGGLLAALAGVVAAAPAQAQACSPFLEVLGPDRQESVASLTTCDVSAVPWSGESPASRIWQLTDQARQRWTTALQGAPLALALADARLRIRHLSEGLQSGTMLPGVSARLLSPPVWRWDARSGEIALSEGDASTARQCRVARPLLLWFGTSDIAQGGTKSAQVYVVHAASDIRALPAHCIDAWRMEPNAHATVDTQGQVRVAENAPDGTRVTLVALVGPKTVRGALRVMDTKNNPLVGVWRQVSETPCDSATQRPPVEPVREFRLDGSGNFAVTATPFEAYKDYWGTYTYDVASGTIRLTVVAGNKMPKDLSLTGQVSRTNDSLELSGLSLQQPQGGTAICAMRFAL